MAVEIAPVTDAQSAEYHKSLALAEKDPTRALPIWRAARSLDPDSPTLVAHEALALHGTGQVDAALALLVEAVGRWPRAAHLLNLLGVCLTEKGHYRLAERIFDGLLGLDPDYPNARGSRREVRRHRKRDVAPPPAVRAAVGAALAEAARRAPPTLAMCMIAKDEEDFVAGAIESVVGLADEIIVVDTGSSDRTVELAREAGARVAFFPWTGDFSAARNASLDHATADWILVLDADERVTPRSRSTIRAVMEEFRDAADPRVVCVRIRNLTRDGVFIGDGFSGRLFHNRPDMRFEGRVHEEVARGRTDVATDYRLDVEFDHFGADPEVMRAKAKDARNIELLEARLAEDPEHLMTWFYLASQHWVAGRRVPALDAFERVVDLFERDPSRYGLGVRQVPVPYSYVGLVRGHLDAGRVDDALRFGARGRVRFDDNPDLAFHLGLAHAAAGEAEAADALLERAAQSTVKGYGLIGMHDRAIGEWKALKARGDLAFEREDGETAYAAYEALGDGLPEAHPDRIAVAARLVELASRRGDPAALLRHARGYLALRPGEGDVAVQVANQLAAGGGLQAAYDLLTGAVEAHPALAERLDVVCTIGGIAEQAGEDGEALRWYERAVSLGCEDPRFWLNLARLLARNGDPDGAREAMALARRLLGEGG